VIGLGTTAAGLVNLFLYDGSAYHLFDQVTVTVVATSTTVASFFQRRYYQQLIIPSGWSLRITNTVAGNVSLVGVVATGANF